MLIPSDSQHILHPSARGTQEEHTQEMGTLYLLGAKSGVLASGIAGLSRSSDGRKDRGLISQQQKLGQKLRSEF